MRGRKSTWKNSVTKLIRVPEVYADILLTEARKLDQGRRPSVVDDFQDMSDALSNLSRDCLIQEIIAYRADVYDLRETLAVEQRRFLCTKCQHEALYPNL